jgi:hypothetical protein
MTSRKQIPYMLNGHIYRHLKVIRGPMRARIFADLCREIDQQLEMVLFYELRINVYHEI